MGEARRITRAIGENALLQVYFKKVKTKWSLHVTVRKKNDNTACA
jgi:hypothetical protein